MIVDTSCSDSFSPRRSFTFGELSASYQKYKKTYYVIPSPFARMDLVRTAFRYITSHGELEGTTIYHRLVSDCLDVAEIFFNIEEYFFNMGTVNFYLKKR